MTHIFGYFMPGEPVPPPDDSSAYVLRQLRGTATDGTDAEPLRAPGCFCGAPLTAVHEDIVLALKGRPTWRGSLIDPGTHPEAVEDLAAAYRAKGEQILDHLGGPFALVLVDSRDRTALLAVDRMGAERMTYAEHRDGIVFGTSAAAVAGFRNTGLHLRDQALFDFLFMHMVPAPNTVFRGVSKLPAASAFVFQDGKRRTLRYWVPAYAYTRNFASLQAGLKEALFAAVRDSGVETSTGAFLSGGLDSSSVAGTLARQSDEPARTFSVGFGEAEYDELRYARIASRHFGCRAFEYNVTPSDIVDAFPRIAASYDEPFGNSSAVPTYFCAKLAADNGVTHLLAGDGGDELFGGNERYARQQVFDFYRRVPRWLRSGLLEPLVRSVDAESGPLPLRKLKSYIDQASVPLPDRFETWNFVYREGRSRLLDSGFAESVDLEEPLDRMREVWSSTPSEQILERMLWYDWQFTLADNDLRKVGTMCELAGVRVSYPMLHEAVVDLSTRVPPRMKMKRLQLRTFFKRAMQDFLPDEILQKRKHGFGLPFGVWLKTDARLGDLIYSLLSDLKKRRIVAAEFLDELIDEHRKGHASYYGYAIWDLAMLEAWLAHHADA